MTLSLTTAYDASASDLPSNTCGDPQPGLRACSDDTWGDLTEADATRVATALAATHAETTRACYANAWGRWTRWCARRALAPYPAEPSAVCAYLAERAEEGVSVSSIELVCCAIGHQHREQGLPNPIDHDAVRRVRKGLRRILGTAPRRPTRPLTLGDLRQIISMIDRTTRQGARDSALVLLGFAGALRRSELAALTLADLEHQPEGLVLHLRRSKTDPHGAGQILGVAHGRHPATDPIAALNSWLTLRGTAPGPLFTSMRPTADAALQPISGATVSSIVKERAAGAGLSAERITAHSLRAGHATSAAVAGASVDRIAAQTRHRRIDVLIARYIQPAQVLQTTSSRDLGL
jgi:integrase